MKKTSDERGPVQKLLNEIVSLLTCDGITQVTQHLGMIQALVDESVPVLIHFVPYQRTNEDEYILQIYFTLSELQTTKTSVLLSRLDELTPHITLGSLCVLPGREIGFKHRLPINIHASSQAVTNVKRSIQLMLLFLFTFLPYVQALAEDPDSITLAQYLEKEGR